MSQLSAVDATFLNFEGGKTVAHVAGLVLLDTSVAPLTRRDLIELVRGRAHLGRPLRRRLATVPFGLDRPYWIQDPDFDPEHHIFDLTLLTPGDDRQLAEQVGLLHERPLDRRRPLWEMTLIHGLTGGRTALYVKVHHAAIDGVSGAEILAGLLDLGPEPREVPVDVTEPERRPHPVRMAATAMTAPLRVTSSALRTARNLDQLPIAGQLPLVGRLARVIRRGSRSWPELPLRAPRTPFNDSISGRREVAFGELSLEDVKRVRRAFGISVNDVVMAICATALRRWLLDRDALPDRPLIAAVPVSLRSGEVGCGDGNRISAMIAPMATHIADARERLEAVRSDMSAVKGRFATSSGSWLADASETLPAPLASLATRAAIQFTPRSMLPINLIISNVPGPQFPLYLGGCRVLGCYPVSVISDLSGGLSITVLSYDGRLDVGILVCPDLVPDAWKLIDYMRDALTELEDLVTGVAA